MLFREEPESARGLEDSGANLCDVGLNRTGRQPGPKGPLPANHASSVEVMRTRAGSALPSLNRSVARAMPARPTLESKRVSLMALNARWAAPSSGFAPSMAAIPWRVRVERDGPVRALRPVYLVAALASAWRAVFCAAVNSRCSICQVARSTSEPAGSLVWHSSEAIRSVMFSMVTARRVSDAPVAGAADEPGSASVLHR
jgi:hypothetical protein